jgi:hypothetical protein
VTVCPPGGMESCTFSPQAEILEKLPLATLIQHVDVPGVVWATNKRTVIKLVGDQWVEVTNFLFVLPGIFSDLTDLRRRSCAPTNVKFM